MLCEYTAFILVNNFFLFSIEYDFAFLGLEELGLAYEQWAWIDGKTLPMDSLMWDCDAPSRLDDRSKRRCGVIKLSDENRYRLNSTFCEQSNFYVCA